MVEYSVRIGIGIDSTFSFSETLRFDFDFLDSDDEELQLACDEAAVKFPRDAADINKSGGEEIIIISNTKA